GRHLRPRPRPRGRGRKGGSQDRGHRARHRPPHAQQGGRGARRAAPPRRGRGRGLPCQARGGRVRDEAHPHAIPSGFGVVLLLRVSRSPLLRPGGFRDLAAGGRPGRAGLLRPVHPLHALLHLPAASVQLLLDRLRRAGRRHARPVPSAGGISAFFPPLPEEKDVPVCRSCTRRSAPGAVALRAPAFSQSLAAAPDSSVHPSARPLRSQMAGARGGGPRRLIYGAPTLNWILLADYLILGLLALAHTWWTSEDRAARRPILVLLLGTVAGIVPFVVFAVFFPSLFREDRYLAWGVVPMAIIPLTFAYAIVRFRLFDVEIIVRKSLVYAILTAVVTGLYALCVVAGNALVSTVSSSTLFSSPSFAFGFGLVVVL